jgi:hypothetical protein
MKRHTSHALCFLTIDLTSARFTRRKATNFCGRQMGRWRNASMRAVRNKPTHPSLIDDRRAGLQAV